MKRLLALGLIVSTTGGCCMISCNGRLPNSHIKISSDIPADCVFVDKAGKRDFYAPGEVLGMPKNAPSTLTCSAKGHKPFSKTLNAQDWSLLTPLSGDPDAIRYFSEIHITFEPLGK